MPGMPWSQQAKLTQAGDVLSSQWEPAALGAGMHIDQMNIKISPPAGQEGDPTTSVIFEWNVEANEYVVRIL